jgi:hypothetical protein
LYRPFHPWSTAGLRPSLPVVPSHTPISETIGHIVPASTKGNTLNLYLDSVPPADDYFLLFLNSTHGVTYTVSPRFTILSSGSTPSDTQQKPAANAQTLTVSGGPNPTASFATTFPASANGVKALWPNAGVHGVGVIVATVALMMGGLMALW